MLYGLETVTLTKRQEVDMEVAEDITMFTRINNHGQDQE